MSVIITSFFTRNGEPANDIEDQTSGFPVIRIWEIDDGSSSGDQFVGEFEMVPVEDDSDDDGFYKFEFTSSDGHDNEKEYVFLVDGGDSLSDSERYQAGEIEKQTLTPSGIADAVWDEDLADHQDQGSTGEALEQADAVADPQTVAEAVWDEQLTDHLSSGSTGEALSKTKADITTITEELFLDTNSVLNIVHTLLKLEAGRTKVDSDNHTLTIFDNDCETPLRVYKLLDAEGNPNVEEICERNPIEKGDGDKTTLTDTC